MGDMRYFVEVTFEQANEFEKTGFAKVAQGASGGSGFGNIVDVATPWLLMRTPELDSKDEYELRA